MSDHDLVLVSSCLAGVRSRYDGGDAAHPAVLALVRAGRALPVCPEQMGGLPTPRPPCERLGDRFLAKEGDGLIDVTDHFRRGAEEALRLALAAGCKRAVLKARSPSCGVDAVYDGTFTGKLVLGNGALAELLRASGVEVMTEEDFQP